MFYLMKHAVQFIYGYMVKGTVSGNQRRNPLTQLRGKSVCSWSNGSSDRSFMVDTLTISCPSQCSTTGVTKAVVCVILSVGWCI